MRYFVLFVLMMTFSISDTFSQRVIKGQVFTFGEFTLGNVRVEAQRAGSAVKTDSTGHFMIVTEDRDVLIFTAEVFNRQRVRINRRTPDSLEVQMHFIDSPLNRQMAVGYGYMRESDLTYAVSQLERNRIDFCQYSDVFELIKGRFPGVQIVGGGRDPEVIVRGHSSFHSSNSALYVVDGQVVNSISHIPPCQISNISVLKDASASIYGSRGANGVVLIETISGK